MGSKDFTDWLTERDLFVTLPGGAEIVEWFGFVPSFHDWVLMGFDIVEGSATLRLKAFRMTNQTGPEGAYVMDKHAIVSVNLIKVTGLILSGNASSIVSRLRIRRMVQEGIVLADWTSWAGPEAGDYEVDIDASYGLYGSLYAREISLTLEPLSAS